MNSEELAGSSEDRTWGTIAHLSALFVFIWPLGGNMIGPLAVWLFKRNDSEMAAEEAKEALNFQITMSLVLLLCVPAFFIGIGAILFFVFLIADLVLLIKAAVHASKGESYSYPFTMRLIG